VIIIPRIPIKIIELAKKQAAKSTMRHKIGSVIYKKNNIISCGYNRWLSIGSNGPKYRYSIHSEADCLLGCSLNELWGSSIYVHRLNGGLAKPCKNCMALLLSHGIQHVYWSGYDETDNTYM
jgi:deoxycytidylate deaminase